MWAIHCPQAAGNSFRATLCLGPSRLLSQKCHRLRGLIKDRNDSYSSEGWDVWDVGASRLGVCWEPSWVQPASMHPHMVEGEGFLWSLLCGHIESGRLCPHDLITPSSYRHTGHWDFNINLWGGVNSLYSLYTEDTNLQKSLFSVNFIDPCVIQYLCLRTHLQHSPFIAIFYSRNTEAIFLRKNI